MAKVYTDLNDIKALITSQGSNFVRLLDPDGNVIVPFNPIGKSWKDRMITSEKKLKALPDGVYKFQAKDNFGPQFYTTTFYFQKGKGTISEIQEDMNPKNGNDAMLSVESAVQNVKEASKATAENEYLKKENEELKKRLGEMDSQIKALQQASEEDSEGMDEEEETASPLNWLKETVPAVLPALDRYFDLKEKELNFKQAKFLHESGYEVPGLPQRKNVPVKKKASQLPQIEGEGWEEFVNYFLSLPDEEYQSRMNWLQQNAPQHYEALLPYVEEESSEEEETETTEDNGPDQTTP